MLELNDDDDDDDTVSVWCICMGAVMIKPIAMMVRVRVSEMERWKCFILVAEMKKKK